MYKNAYPNKLFKSDHGLLGPEMFCPNKALQSLQFLSLDAKENHDQNEVRLELSKSIIDSLKIKKDVTKHNCVLMMFFIFLEM